MSNYKKKHQLLGLISENERQKSLSATNYTEIGKGLSGKQIHDSLKYNLKDIEILCDSLTDSGYLTQMAYDQNPNEIIYCITSKGKQAFHNKTLFNKEWYRSRAVWFSIIALFFSMLAVIIASTKTCNCPNTKEQPSKQSQMQPKQHS